MIALRPSTPVRHETVAECLTKPHNFTVPQPGARFVVSDGPGRYPRWAPDGRTLYYWRDRTLVAASVRTALDCAVTGRRDLFTMPRARPHSTMCTPMASGS